MTEGERGYLGLMADVLENGSRRDDRTGVGTLSVFGRQLRFNLRDGFPAITTKRLAFKSVVAELLWFLRGDTNVGWLRDNGCTIWDEWADENGDLGPIYGSQWRRWKEYGNEAGHVDQIRGVIDSIRNSPHSRRHIVSAWNVSDVPRMALAPCHAMFQFYVEDDELSCQLYQRSADLFLGVPFNVASYALLTSMIAQVVGLRVGEFIHTFGDVHIYNNHVDQVRLQLKRDVKQKPKLVMNADVLDIDGFSVNDFSLSGYEHHPAIHAEVAK